MTPRSLTPGFSLSLDLIRFWAALVVFFSHFAVQQISGGLFWQFNIIPFGHHAVVFFFVLSGLYNGLCRTEPREFHAQIFFGADRSNEYRCRSYAAVGPYN